MKLIPYSIIGSKEIFEQNNPKRLNSLLNETSSSSIPAALKIMNHLSAKRDEKQILNYNNNIIKMENSDISRMYINLKKRIQSNDVNFI